MTTGYLYDPRLLQHDAGPQIPEVAARLSLADLHLRTQSWFSQLKCYAAKPAPLRWIAEVHSEQYIQRARETCAAGAATLDQPDVGICEVSYDVALLAAGAALVLGDAVMSGEVGRAFGLIRPPGHHAERDMAMGFCLFNNIAILARYLQKRHGVERVAIVDWDVHHGNGTQHSFESDPTISYISLHQYPLYPGTGASSEKGVGKGLGYTLNIPLTAGSGDVIYRRAFAEQVIPFLDKVKPEVLLISAGFDAHKDDLLGGMALTTEMFAWMTGQLIEVADRHAKGRLISLLEGGYNLTMLPYCVAAHLEALL